MLGSQLKRLADCAEVSKIDIIPAPITIVGSPQGTVSWYQGAYAACGIHVDVPFQHGIAVRLGAKEFQTLVGVFDDADEVDIFVSGATVTDMNTFHMKSHKRDLKMQCIGTPNIDGYAGILSAQTTMKVDREMFNREANAASTATAKDMSIPILKAIRVIARDGIVGLQASNGASLVFESRLGCTIDGGFETLAPSDDFIMGLKLMSGEFIDIGMMGRALIMRCHDLVIKIPTIAGSWPNVKSVKAQTFGEELVIPISTIKLLSMAKTVYKAAPTIRISPQEGAVLLETMEAETGQMREVIDGAIVGTYVLDIEDLDIAARMSQDALTIQFGSNASLVKSGGRSLYILQRF